MSRAPIDDVGDTARWVAYFRALESERPDALFRDRHARRLAGERGRAIAESLPKGPLAWSLAVRTRVFDEIILDAVQRGGVRTVLNLAAGLDARPHRLDLPADLRWIEVDRAALLAWKEEALAGERAACVVERVPLDLTDRGARRDLLARVGAEAARVGAQAARVLVVTEGLLVYLDEAEVASLADDLLGAFPDALWLLENIAPVILETQRRRWGKTLRAGQAEMKFAPAEGLEFFRAHGWSPREIRSLLDEAQRLGREMPLAGIMRFFASLIPGRQEKYRKAAVHALLERAG